MARRVLLMTQEKRTTSAVAEALQNNGQLSPDDVCSDLQGLSRRLDSAAAPAALVDIDAHPESTLGALESLVRRHAQTRFIVLSDALRSEWLLQAMQAGARHYVIKGSIAADLEGVIYRLCPVEAGTANGLTVAVLSAAGGCGATTIAANIAFELNQLLKEPTLAIDLDYRYGGLAGYLGLDSEYGLLDLLSRGGAIDAHLIQTTIVKGRGGVDALLSTSASRLGEVDTPLEPARLMNGINACRQTYRATVIDAPRVSNAVATALARSSDLTLLLMQLTVRDVRSARRTLRELAARGVRSDAVVPVFTRYRRRGPMITLDEAVQALGAAADATTVANDFPAVIEALNLGKPLYEVAGRSDVRRDIRQLAERAHKACPANAVTAAIQNN